MDPVCSFFFGKLIVKALESIAHPKNVICSRNIPSASIFRFEAMIGRGRGSSLSVDGRNVKCNAIRLALLARITSLALSSESSTAVALSSMYPSTPAVTFLGNVTSASRASPNGVSSLILSGSRIRFINGNGVVAGSQFSHSIRSDVRSKVGSDICEK